MLPGSHIPPVLVPGQHVYARYVAPDHIPRSYRWGFRAEVTGLKNLVWTSEHDALLHPSLPWMIWLGRFLLHDVNTSMLPRGVKNALFNDNVIGGLLDYSSLPSAPGRGLALSLTIHILSQRHLLPSSIAAAQRLADLRSQAEKVRQMLKLEADRPFPPVHLQTLLELSAVSLWATQHTPDAVNALLSHVPFRPRSKSPLHWPEPLNSASLKEPTPLNTTEALCLVWRTTKALELNLQLPIDLMARAARAYLGKLDRLVVLIPK